MQLKYIHIKDASVQTMLGRRLGFAPEMAEEEFPIGWYYIQCFGMGAGAFYSVHKSLDTLIEAYEDQVSIQKPLVSTRLSNGFYGIEGCKPRGK